MYTLVSKVFATISRTSRGVFALKLGWPQRGGYTLSLGGISREVPVIGSPVIGPWYDMRPENWGLFCVPTIFHFHKESFRRTPITMLNTCNRVSAQAKCVSFYASFRPNV
jgi:hypothetical protein